MTFMTLLRYTAEGASSISGERTKKLEQLLKELGGKLMGGYGLLGHWDAALFYELPDATAGMKAAVRIAKLTQARTETMAAMPLAEFDKLF